jgi:hypothetical protein
LEAETSHGRFPALFLRQFGSGQTAYLAFGETWRWRNEVAGKYQERFWNQLVNELGEANFSALDERIALDTDALSYSPGANAVLRARIRDGKTRNTLEGTLWRDGIKVAAVNLRADSSRPDLMAGRTEPLEAGVYDFGIAETGDSEGSPLRVRFEVAAPHTGELSELTLNEPLLVQMSSESHGRYLREEDVKELPELLKPFTTGQVIETEVPLWQGYGWFSVIIALLSAEWVLRKKSGLI